MESRSIDLEPEQNRFKSTWDKLRSFCQAIGQAIDRVIDWAIERMPHLASGYGNGMGLSKGFQRSSKGVLASPSYPACTASHFTTTTAKSARAANFTGLRVIAAL